MRNLLLIAFLLLLFAGTKAATLPTSEPPLNASTILLPVGTTGKCISLMELSTIRVKDFEALHGKKLSLFQRIGFRLSQRKLRSQINKDGTLTEKAMQKYTGQPVESGGGFHAGGFFLGLLLNIYAIPIVYLMRDENRMRRIKWMWIGLGTVLTLLTLILLAMTGGRFR